MKTPKQWRSLLPSIKQSNAIKKYTFFFKLTLYGIQKKRTVYFEYSNSVKIGREHELGNRGLVGKIRDGHRKKKQ